MESPTREVYMSAYKYLSRAWRDPSKSYVKELMREQAVKWRREPTITRVRAPSRLDRARRLGFKAKRGYIIVRVRVRKGGARKERPRSGRRQKALGVKKYTRAKSLKKIAEEKAQRRFKNLASLNSYWVWDDGKHVWYEVVMADPEVLCGVRSEIS